MRFTRSSATIASTLALALALALEGPALADGKGHAKGNGHSGGKIVRMADQGANRHATAFCPPGLAKKDPACVPPGLAKKQVHHSHAAQRSGKYEIGDAVPAGAWILIENPQRLGLVEGSYLRSGDYVYRVDPGTRQVLALVGLADALLN